MDKIALNELQYVEESFLRQLERLGWQVIRGDKYDPAVSLREGFNEVIIEKELREAIRRINPWIDDDQIAEVVHDITTPESNSLLSANQEILNLLLENTSVSENRKTGERSPTVRFIDFKNPKNNSLLAISQFKVNIPGTEKHIVPDIVLFVNGLPLVVIECKSPYIADPMSEGITQLLRYQNRRGEREGNEKLFWYNQIVVATSRQVAKYSSITGEFEHFIEWKDPYPSTLAEIQTEGSEVVNSQQVLIQGMLTPENLLDIVQCFILFKENEKGEVVKLVPRYQQFRTVQKIIRRLKTRKKPLERGGIVWHTQGSGKSFTMMFAVRKMYRDPDFAKYKTVFITDRRDLERQLRDTAKSVGYTLNVAKRIAELKELLKTTTPDLVMGMIHKFQEWELTQEFPVLNTSENIIMMIDEAHRTQYKLLGANLQKGLPNATKIAFTGTPIEKTETTFGDYIDKYTIRQAVEDGVTVEIIYEGRTHIGEISDKEAMNKRFEDVFSYVDEDSRREILGRYTWKAYLEAEEVIRDKARDMMDHYLTHIFPNRFKAQVVAVSRLAAIRYKAALDLALKEKIQQYEKDGMPSEKLEPIKRLQTAVVISGSPNDGPEFHPFTDEQRQEKIIQSFKMPFDKVSDDGVSGDIGIIVVQSMLLTGFDAPVEQVMYLDDVIKEHNLLQAIARVNRVYQNKTAGFIVDYVGVAKHLREALAVFDAKDLDEMLTVIKDQEADLDALTYSRSQVLEFFKKYGIEDISDIDSCIDILADEETRNEFISLFRSFTKTMDRVLPRVEGLKFTGDLKKFSFISESARNRYRDEKLSIKDASRKIREIVDEFLISKGVDPKIPPLPIFSEKFRAKITKEKSAQAKAEELKHAIRDHILHHAEEDPELYERFSDKLERLLKEYKENWELLAKELEGLLGELRKGRLAEESFGLNPNSEVPFLGLLKRDIFGVKDIGELNKEQIDLLVQTTKDTLEIIRREIARVDFWENYTAQKRLKSYIISHLLTAFRNNREVANKRNLLAQKLIELAFHLRDKLAETDVRD
jgi:type I restriction enzyme R subunit